MRLARSSTGNTSRMAIEMLPQHGRRVVRVVLQDGRQLEGELLVLTGRYQVGDDVFFYWQIEELEDIE